VDKKFSPIDLTQVSKKTLGTNKRIEEQAAEFLKKHDAKLKEEAILQEKKKHDAMVNGAMFSKNSAYVKNKNRSKAVQEAIGYTDKATRLAMTDVITTIVESSLLIDASEFSKLNPDYKKEIREQVSAILENGNLSSIVRNRKTLKIMEHVARSIPDVKTGVYLKEEELIDIVRKSTPAEINNVISSLTGDVKERVANLVVKEQDDAAQIQKEIEDVAKTSEEAKAAKLKALGYTDEEILAAMAPGGAEGPESSPEAMAAQMAGAPEGATPAQGAEPSPEELAAMQQPQGDQQPADAGEFQGEPSPEELAAAQQGQGAVPSPEELAAIQQAPGITNPAPEFDEYGQEIEPEMAAAQPEMAAAPVEPIQTSGVPQTANKNTAVEIAPDGTVRVNIVRENFYREHPKQGILESLALNEALDMVKSGKPYNGDLALANAIVQLTVLETFNTTGLMPISELDYSRMLNIPLRSKRLREEEHGSAAAKPIATSDAPADEHTPSASKEDVHTSQSAEEVKAPIIESWKDKILKELNRMEMDKPWNKKREEDYGKVRDPKDNLTKGDPVPKKDIKDDLTKGDITKGDPVPKRDREREDSQVRPIADRINKKESPVKWSEDTIARGSTK
jgi:hypothetical protein